MLRRVVTLEAAIPLFVAAAASAGVGLLAADLFLQAQLSVSLVGPAACTASSFSLEWSGPDVDRSDVPDHRANHGPRGGPQSVMEILDRHPDGGYPQNPDLVVRMLIRARTPSLPMVRHPPVGLAMSICGSPPEPIGRISLIVRTAVPGGGSTHASDRPLRRGRPMTVAPAHHPGPRAPVATGPSRPTD